MSSNPNSISQAQGIFSNCGLGVNTYELHYNCKGPACISISGFPNVTCRTEKDGVSCSNDVKCQDGSSSYHSNFTFGQNEADPWNPNSQNEIDSLVQQQQHIAISSCAKFSLTSDGTRDGTKVDDEEYATENTCPNIQETSAPAEGIVFAEKPSPTEWPHTGVTIMPVTLQSSMGSRGNMSKNMLFITILLILLVLIRQADASHESHQRSKLSQRAALRIRDVRNQVEQFAQGFSKDLAEKSSAQDPNGEVFAHNLVADVVSSVCSGYFRGAEPSDFTPAIVQNCVQSIYGGERLAQPAAQFHAVFGASLLCGYVVSEAYPVAREFLPGGCDGLQEITKRIPPADSATVLEAATIVASQIFSRLVIESSTAQPSGLRQTATVSPPPIPSSFYSPLLPLDSSTLGSSSAHSQPFFLDSNSASKPQETLPNVSRPARSSTSGSGAQTHVPPPLSDSPSPMVSVTPSSQSPIPSAPALASLQVSTSNQEDESHEAIPRPSRRLSSSMRSLSNTLSSPTTRKSQSTSSLLPSSRSLLGHGYPQPFLPKEPILLSYLTLSDSLSKVDQSSTTLSGQVSLPRSTSRPTSQKVTPVFLTSRSSINPPTHSTVIPTITSLTPSSNSWVRTPSRVISSSFVNTTTRRMSENSLVYLSSFALEILPPKTNHSSHAPNSNPTIPSFSTSTEPPTSEPPSQPVTQSAHLCSGILMTGNTHTHCSSYQKSCQDSLKCSQGSNHSYMTEELPTMLSSHAPLVPSSISIAESSIPKSSTLPVSSMNVGSLPSTSSSTSVILSLSQSPTKRPTSGSEVAGGFIAKGFDGWW